MRRRLISGLLIASLVLQALLGAPVALGGNSGVHEGAVPSHCAEHTSSSGKHDCPCCPDGVSTMADCMTSCAPSANAVSFTVAEFEAAAVEPVPFVAAASLTHTRAPPDPPPIR